MAIVVGARGLVSNTGAAVGGGVELLGTVEGAVVGAMYATTGSGGRVVVDVLVVVELVVLEVLVLVVGWVGAIVRITGAIVTSTVVGGSGAGGSVVVVVGTGMVVASVVLGSGSVVGAG